MTPNQPDKYSRVRDGYQTLMKEIVRRYEVILSFLYENKFAIFKITQCEVLAINFRKIAELIVFANLIGHEEEYSSLHSKYADEWRLVQIIQRIKNINPNYYPRAVSFKKITTLDGNEVVEINNRLVMI